MKKYLFVGLLALLFLYALLCAFGVTNTFWGWDARHSEWYWKVLCLAILAWVVYLFKKWNGTSIAPGQWFLLYALTVIALMSSTGFKSTAGDLKQVITYLDTEGKVADTDVLFNCYEEFYHFNSNPELKSYVLTYGELPGRNRWNTYILSGDIPKSTAPRADEDFEWHTGSYEMDLKNNKNCR